MKIHEERHGDVTVLKLKGSMMSGPEVTPMQDRVKKLASEGLSKVVVDLSQVTWFGSAMLGVMASSLMTLQGGGGGLCLAGITPKVAAIMRVTRLDGVFEKRVSVEEAVASFT